MVIELLRYKDKQTILSKPKLLKGASFYINKDYSNTVCQKREELVPAMKAARAREDTEIR